MTNKLIFVWCLSYLYVKVDAGKSSHLEELSDDSRCDFDVPRIYGVTDLLRCMEELAIDFSENENNDRSLKQSSSQSESLAYRENSYEFPYGNLIPNLFNLFNQVPLPSIYNDLAGNYYPLNRPDTPSYEPSDQFDGIGANLFDALSSISRYDDLKCVPRILCEVANGNSPGEISERTSAIDYLSDFGRNAFTQWLTRLDVAETSPVLNFARATALGYSSSRGNPGTCYRAFPRCPRNRDKLVHYLNNHNGGFFRFFSQRGRERERGSYPPRSPHASQDNAVFLGAKKRKALPPGFAGAEADRTGTGQLKFDLPVSSARRDYEKSFFPKEILLEEGSRRVVFPVNEETNHHPSSKRSLAESSKELRNIEAGASSFFPPSFFQRESQDKDVRPSAFFPQLPDSIPRDEFRFER